MSCIVSFAPQKHQHFLTKSSCFLDNMVFKLVINEEKPNIFQKKIWRFYVDEFKNSPLCIQKDTHSCMKSMLNSNFK